MAIGRRQSFQNSFQFKWTKETRLFHARESGECAALRTIYFPFSHQFATRWNHQTFLVSDPCACVCVSPVSLSADIGMGKLCEFRHFWNLLKCASLQSHPHWIRDNIRLSGTSFIVRYVLARRLSVKWVKRNYSFAIDNPVVFGCVSKTMVTIGVAFSHIRRDAPIRHMVNVNNFLKWELFNTLPASGLKCVWKISFFFMFRLGSVRFRFEMDS